MKYIWLNDNTAIREQISSEFQSIRIVLNPFVIMPTNYNENESNRPYPNSTDILEFGNPVNWKTIIDRTGLDNYSELCLGLKTGISALNSAYQRTDLYEVLMSKINENEFFPQEDKISEFVLRDIFNFFLENGNKYLNYHMPIENLEGSIPLTEEHLKKLCELYNSEIIIFDENCEYVFMSVYDSFITLFLSKSGNEYANHQFDDWEMINCDNNTKINWYMDEVK